MISKFYKKDIVKLVNMKVYNSKKDKSKICSKS